MSDKVTMKALDTLHISNVQADNLQAGDVFVVTESDAKALEKQGLAERGGTASNAVNADRFGRPDPREDRDADREAKAEKAAPANKMEAAPANKTISVATAASSSRRVSARKGK